MPQTIWGDGSLTLFNGSTEKPEGRAEASSATHAPPGFDLSLHALPVRLATSAQSKRLALIERALGDGTIF